MYSHGLIAAVFIIAVIVSLNRFLKKYYLEKEPTLKGHPIGAAFGFPLFLIGFYAVMYGVLWALLPSELSQLRLDSDIAQNLTFDQANALFDMRKWAGIELLIILVLAGYCIFGLFRRGQISEKNIRNSANLIVWGILLFEVYNLLKIHSNLNEHGISGGDEFKYIRSQLIGSIIAISLFFWGLIKYVKTIELVYKHGTRLSIPLPFGGGTSDNMSSNSSNSQSETSANMEKKRCPYCGEEILVIAKKCKHCGEWLDKEENTANTPSAENTTMENTAEEEKKVVTIGDTQDDQAKPLASEEVKPIETKVEVPYIPPKPVKKLYSLIIPAIVILVFCIALAIFHFTYSYTFWWEDEEVIVGTSLKILAILLAIYYFIVYRKHIFSIGRGLGNVSPSSRSTNKSKTGKVKIAIAIIAAIALIFYLAKINGFIGYSSGYEQAETLSSVFSNNRFNSVENSGLLNNEAFSSRMKALVGDSYYSELKNRQSGHIAVISREGSSPSLYGICLINYRARDKYVYVLYDSTSDNLTVIQCETSLDDEYIDYKQEKSDYKIPHSFINRKLHYSSDM